MRWQALYELAVHYLTQLRAHGQNLAWTTDNINRTFLTLVLCDALGQLRFIPGGFYCWLRMHPEHVESIGYSRDLAAVAALGMEELTTGQVCFVTEVLAEKPGQAYRAMRELRKEPGITHYAAWRGQTRRAEGKIHGR